MTTKSQLASHLTRISPLSLAGTWDNVGMLLELSPLDQKLSGVLLTIDLNEAVVDEAIAQKANFIVSYHPVLFTGAKRLSARSPNDRALLKAIENNISIFSPHTALDAVEGGITDWLLEQVGAIQNVSIIEPSATSPNSGMGRMGQFTSPRALSDVLSSIKRNLNLNHLRVATALGKSTENTVITQVAVCPGAGFSVVKNATGHDCIVTGEMRHHDVLYAQSLGVTTILTEHTNCERGYLPLYKQKIVDTFPTLPVRMSQRDRDPLMTM